MSSFRPILFFYPLFSIQMPKYWKSALYIKVCKKISVYRKIYFFWKTELQTIVWWKIKITFWIYFGQFFTPFPHGVWRGFESHHYQTCCRKYVRKRWNMTLGHISWTRQSGWPSGLRRCVQVAVYLCRRGFESHFWQRPILSIVRDISSIYVPEIYRWYTVRSGEDHKSCRT